MGYVWIISVALPSLPIGGRLRHILCFAPKAMQALQEEEKHRVVRAAQRQDIRVGSCKILLKQSRHRFRTTKIIQC